MIRLAGCLLFAGCFYEYTMVTRTDQDGPSEPGETGSPPSYPEVDTRQPDVDPSAIVLAEGELTTITVSFTVEGALELAFLVDTTRSMDSLMDALKLEFGAIATTVDSDFPDVTWGFATFDDYGMSPYGSGGLDIPFLLRAAQTTDLAVVQTALATAAIHDGEDAPEASMEALWQGLTGTGYDLDCDGLYDVGYDVLPFIASPTDPFGGLAGQSGTAGRGGFGFSEDKLPVIVYATNYEMRDADDARYNTPGGCPQDAGMSDVASAMTALSAKAVGVAVNMHDASYTVAQMRELGQRTSSYADLDGDGAVEPAVLLWSSSSTVFRESLVAAIGQLLEAMTWQRVWLEVDDPYGIVVDIEPDERFDVHSGQTVRFDVTLQGIRTGSPVTLTFHLMADGGVMLATRRSPSRHRRAPRSRRLRSNSGRPYSIR